MRNDCLMVQGTTSDAGKTVLVAGICRLFARNGINVAPFKPQNMALNSAVTEDGGEIGRAQALQAEACFIQSHTDMNPILLKPESDTGAQVIVQGKALSDMEAGAFHDYKWHAMEAVLESFDRLQKRYDMIVVEGAGSPAEINLRENDIANMGFAEAVDCPVILVADIDRGGVFAHLVGTLELLSQSEQSRVVGFVINKFRGDIALLQPGLDWLEQRTGKPVLGVLPYLQDFYLDAEDSIAPRQRLNEDKGAGRLSVVIPVLSRISNHTDFDALRLHPQVDLQFVSIAQKPPVCDLIILPGSKHVRNDLTLLQEHGWASHVRRHLRYGGKLLGICGGFQMLGELINDELGIEGAAGTSRGLGLLNLTTTLLPQKQLKQVDATLASQFLFPNESLGTSNRVTITGYEIHCGVSIGAALERPFARYDDEREEGTVSEDGQIIGTYIHGLFDHPLACQNLLRWAGLFNVEELDISSIRDQQLNRLADVIEQELKLPTMYKVDNRAKSNC